MNTMDMSSAVCRRRAWIGGLGAIVAHALLTGCASDSDSASSLWRWIPFGPKPVQRLTLIASADVNAGYPVAVDVVFVRSRKLYEALEKLRAAEWFTARGDHLRQSAKDLSVRSWEVVPRQVLRDVAVTEDSERAVGTLVFADYLGPGAYRVNVAEHRALEIRLSKTDFEVVYP